MTGKKRAVAALTFKEFDIVPIEIDDCCGTKFEYPGWYQGSA